MYAACYSILGKSCLRFFHADVWRAYDNADIIIVGHDGVFSDANLLFAIFASMIGKKQVIFGMGFGGFKSVLARKMARFIMPLFDLIVLRERATFERLKAVGVPENIMHVKPDPAFFLKPAGDKELAVLLHSEALDTQKGPLIGMIAVRGSVIFDNCFDTVTDRKEKYELHKKLFCRIAEKIIEFTRGTVVFLPHCIGYEPNRDDRLVARDIREAMPIGLKEKIILIESEYDAATLKRLIGKLDFLVAERTHALIGSCSIGTPFLAITVKQDTRTHGIIANIFGMPDQVIDINNPDTESILGHFTNAWDTRGQIKEALREKAAKVHEECHEAARMLANVIRN